MVMMRVILTLFYQSGSGLLPKCIFYPLGGGLLAFKGDDIKAHGQMVEWGVFEQKKLRTQCNSALFFFGYKF